MSEQAPPRPVIEVRETFTPSEPLRRELMKFIIDTNESRRATLLFKSWRRRLIDVEEYATSERDRGGPLYTANLLFEGLPRTPIRVTGLAIADSQSDDDQAPSRLVLRAPMTDTFINAERILDKIPTIESTQPPLTSRTWLFEEVAGRSLLKANASRSLLLRGLSSRLADPQFAPNYTVVPTKLSIRHTFWRDPNAVSEDQRDVDPGDSETQTA